MILSDCLINQCTVKLQLFCFGSADSGGFFVFFSSKKPPRSSDHIDLNCIFMVANAPKAELRFSFSYYSTTDWTIGGANFKSSGSTL